MLTSENRIEYKKYLANNPYSPIYIQDWYLDLVCGQNNWGAAIVKKSEQVVAVLPYYLKSNKLFNWIGMPPLSKLHGPHIVNEYNNNRHHHSIIDELIDQLPPVAFYQQAMDYKFTNWLPFLWKDFSQVTLYSYVFPAINLDLIYENIKPDIRRKLKLNSSKLHLKTGLSFRTFYDVFEKTYKRQKLNVPFSYEFLANYYKVLKSKSAAELLFVVDDNEIVHTATMLIWDRGAAYYIMEGTDPDAPNKYSGAIMKWETIKYVKEVLNLDRFDFEGSISKRIERTYREFGAIPQSYFVIKKYNSKLFLLLKFIQNYKQYGKLVQW